MLLIVSRHSVPPQSLKIPHQFPKTSIAIGTLCYQPRTKNFKLRQEVLAHGHHAAPDGAFYFMNRRSTNIPHLRRFPSVFHPCSICGKIYFRKQSWGMGKKPIDSMARTGHYRSTPNKAKNTQDKRKGTRDEK